MFILNSNRIVEMNLRQNYTQTNRKQTENAKNAQKPARQTSPYRDDATAAPRSTHTRKIFNPIGENTEKRRGNTQQRRGNTQQRRENTEKRREKHLNPIGAKQHPGSTLKRKHPEEKAPSNRKQPPNHRTTTPHPLHITSMGWVFFLGRTYVNPTQTEI